MNTEPKVLVIEPDEAVGNELQAILGFINYTPLWVANCEDWKSVAGTEEDILAVLVGSCGSDQMLSDLLGEIHRHDEHLPIYLLSRKGREPTVTIDTGSCILIYSALHIHCRYLLRLFRPIIK